jgi:ribosomal protein S18 acetylase RimI-like enzyme
MATSAKQAVRPLQADDLERMIAIDQAHTGRARRRFFEKRFESAKTHPQDFVHVGVSRDGTLVGFAFARILHGEFGRAEPTAALDLVGVDPTSQGHGCGHALMDGLADAMRARGVRQLHSQADWTNHGLLKFFDSTKFILAPRLVLERAVAEPLAEPAEEI